jgi:hypothetical protein
LQPTELERQEIYLEEKAIDAQYISWFLKDGSYKLKAPVLRPNGEELTLTGVIGNNGNISFNLMYKSTLLIRRFDHRTHTNPDGSIIRGPHKHKWTERHGDNIAYEVDDILLSDINTALECFLNECNISIEGEYPKVLL